MTRALLVLLMAAASAGAASAEDIRYEKPPSYLSGYVAPMVAPGQSMMPTTAPEPSIDSGFGSGATIVSGSSDSAGTVNVGDVGYGGPSPVYSGVIAFANSWPTTPVCVVQNASSWLFKTIVSTTTLEISTSGPWDNNAELSWMCMGRMPVASGQILVPGTPASPTIVSGFGTDPAVVAGSFDSAGSVDVGTIDMGTVNYTGVVAFSTTWPEAPQCVVTIDGTYLTQFSVTATALTTTSASGSWADHARLHWICIGRMP
jgi:hypothetical protein